MSIDWSAGYDLVVVAFTGAGIAAESKGAAVDETISLGVPTGEVILDDLTHLNGALRKTSFVELGRWRLVWRSTPVAGGCQHLSTGSVSFLNEHCLCLHILSLLWQPLHCASGDDNQPFGSYSTTTNTKTSIGFVRECSRSHA